LWASAGSSGYAISGAQEPEMFLPMFDIAVGIVDPIVAEA